MFCLLHFFVIWLQDRLLQGVAWNEKFIATRLPISLVLLHNLDTTSPLGTIAPSTPRQGCPQEYSTGILYAPKTKVAVPSRDSMNFLVYECSADFQQSRFCSQFAPNHWSQLGWIKVGFCDGSSAPTSSPIFNALAEIEDGCPSEFSITVEYKAGDKVSVLVDAASNQALVFQCKEYPYSSYCNVRLEEFAPYSENSDFGWELLGFCSGTTSPTTSPVSYPDAKCRYYDDATSIIIKEWSLADLPTYAEGTKVRVNDAIFVSDASGCLLYQQYLIILVINTLPSFLFVEMQELPIFRLVPQQCL